MYCLQRYANVDLLDSAGRNVRSVCLNVGVNDTAWTSVY